MSGLEIINRMNYRVNFDRSYTTITRTESGADSDINVYNNLRHAKINALSELRNEIAGLKEAIRRIKALTKEECEIE